MKIFRKILVHLNFAIHFHVKHCDKSFALFPCLGYIVIVETILSNAEQTYLNIMSAADQIQTGILCVKCLGVMTQ